MKYRPGPIISPPAIFSHASEDKGGSFLDFIHFEDCSDFAISITARIERKTK